MRRIQDLWYRLSIRTKLMTFSSILILCISFLNLYTLSNAYMYMDIYAQDLEKTSMIHRLENKIINCSSAFESWAAGNNQSLTIYNELIPEVWEAWNNVLKTSGELIDARFQISAIRYAFLAYNSTALEAQNSHGSSEEDFIKNLVKTRRIRGYINTYLKNLINIRLGEGSRIHALQVEKVNTIRLISFLGIGIISALLLFFGTLFSESVSRPIRILAARSSRMAEGVLSVEEIDHPSKDEVGVLTGSFNRMSRNIHEMVKSLEDKVEIEKQLREDELKIAEINRSLKEAQFLSLQSQISPHFLFNTLNTISRTSMFEKAPETVKLIEALSNVFRYTLNEQSRIVTMKEEVKILEEYMHIQKSRYGERIDFHTDFQVPLSEIKLPIFTIQPLVENAIKYGIEPSEEGGRITLKTTLDDKENINILIEDTGAGISRENLIRIMNSDMASESENSSGIGIQNVRRRLKLVYDNRETFNIESSLGKGTKIIIIIPGSENCTEY